MGNRPRLRVVEVRAEHDSGDWVPLLRRGDREGDSSGGWQPVGEAEAADREVDLGVLTTGVVDTRDGRAAGQDSRRLDQRLAGRGDWHDGSGSAGAQVQLVDRPPAARGRLAGDAQMTGRG